MEVERDMSFMKSISEIVTVPHQGSVLGDERGIEVYLGR